MRRKDREISDILEMCKILDNCKVMRVAMSCDNVPYVVPLNFGYVCDNNVFTLCFHCADVGKKIDIIKNNPTVCFEVDCDHDLIVGNVACDYGFKFSSVIGTGKAQFVTDVNEKCELLSVLMAHQTGKAFEFTEKLVRNVNVCKISVCEISGKRCTRLD